MKALGLAVWLAAKYASYHRDALEVLGFAVARDVFVATPLIALQWRDKVRAA